MEAVLPYYRKSAGSSSEENKMEPGFWAAVGVIGGALATGIASIWNGNRQARREARRDDSQRIDGLYDRLDKQEARIDALHEELIREREQTAELRGQITSLRLTLGDVTHRLETMMGLADFAVAKEEMRTLIGYLGSIMDAPIGEPEERKRNIGRNLIEGRDRE